MTVLLEAQNKRRRCDATCHHAKGEKCNCICKGAFHGIGEKMPEPVEFVVKSAAIDFADEQVQLRIG